MNVALCPRMAFRGVIGAFASVAIGALAGCSKAAPAEPSSNLETVPVTSIPGHESLLEDTSRKSEARLIPQETLIRNYLSIFGGLSPIDLQTRLRAGSTSLFDSWSDYLGALGFPNYESDLPRASRTNALMLASFERIGVALCDKAAEADLGKNARALTDRTVFRFEMPAAAPLDTQGFTQRFDVLHRTFLSYPVALAPSDRVTNFFALYKDILARHQARDAGVFTSTPAQSAWAAVCYGLVRHPEFHLY